MKITKFNIDTKRNIVTILINDDKIVTITNSDKTYNLLFNRTITCKDKKFIDILNEQVSKFIQQQALR